MLADPAMKEEAAATPPEGSSAGAENLSAGGTEKTFGYAWDRNLTDKDGHGQFAPYIELMSAFTPTISLILVSFNPERPNNGANSGIRFKRSARRNKPICKRV